MPKPMSIFDELSTLEPFSKPSPQREGDLDKFATLFSPSTPRASPTFAPTPLPNVDTLSFDPIAHTESHKTRPSRSGSTSSQQSDFGAFVSVSASEDPLSGDFPFFEEEEGLPTPVMTATPTTATAAEHHPDANTKIAVPPPPHPSSDSSSTVSNQSLSFFDQFAQGARERSATRSAVLDELLLHQDDPLYFLKEQQDKDVPDTSTPSTVAESKSSLDEPEKPAVSEDNTSITPSTSENSDPAPVGLILDLDVHNDLDHDYFRIAPSSSNSSLESSSNTSRKPSIHRRGRVSAPTRSSSIPMPTPTLAPPVQSSLDVTGSPSLSRSPPTSPILSSQLAHSPPADGVDPNDDEGEEEDAIGPGHLGRASSFQSLSGSLSSLPVRWVSTLLRGPQQGSPGQARSIESMFGSIENDGKNDRDHSLNSPTPTPNTLRSASHRPSHHQTSPTQPTFTHTSAFAPPPITPGSATSVSHVASPFAPHVYVPPSGAPGYTGESYGWDKGFSDELEAERDRESGRTQNHHQRSQTMPVVMAKDRQRQEMSSDSTAGSASSSSKPTGGGGGGWGSGFGFSFGSVRSGKTLSPPSSGSPLYKDGLPSSSSHPTGSGSASFWDSQERGLGSGSRNVSEGSDLGRGRGSAGRRPGDPNGVGEGGNGKFSDTDVDDGIGAFIERKSGKVELVGRKAATTPILTSELASMLRPSLPALSRLPRSWMLIYSLDQDGISLNTLYSKCEAHLSRREKPGEINNSAMLIVIRDANGAIFGAWLAEGVRLNKGGRGYFGGGESFLWKYTASTLKVFKCTGKNNYIALCEPEYISFGGGDGHYGLYLDDTLFDGSSAPCPTFDNEPLCSPGPRKGSSVMFECVGLEVWGMGP